MIEDELYDKVCSLEGSSQILSFEDSCVIGIYLDLYDKWLVSDNLDLKGSIVFQKVTDLVDSMDFSSFEGSN